MRENILVTMAAIGPPSRYAQTAPDGNTSGVPGTMLHRTIQLNTASHWDHHCPTSDANGCNTDSQTIDWCDARICISHELGHAEGLGHCGIDFGVMCHVNAVVHGTAFWTPQSQERLGIQVLYP